MEFAMNLKIVNDTIFDLNYYLVIDNKERYSKSLASGAINEIVFQHGQLISIEKNDIWNFKGKAESLFLFLYSCDFTFGNLSDPDNLPLNINYNVDKNDLYSKKDVHMSDIIFVNPTSLIKWKKFSMLQFCLLTFLMVLVGVALSFIFSGWLQCLFLVGCLGIIVTFLFLLLKKRKKDNYEFERSVIICNNSSTIFLAQTV